MPQEIEIFRAHYKAFYKMTFLVSFVRLSLRLVDGYDDETKTDAQEFFFIITPTLLPDHKHNTT